MRRLLLLAALAAFPVLARAAPHGLTAADLVSLSRASEPALSPDGRRLVFTLRETDLAADRGRTDLWLQDLDGNGAPRRLTSNEENDSAADWAADGSGVFFLSSRSGSAQVWYLATAGGEAIQVTRFPFEVAGFRASPRSDRLLVALEVFPDCRVLDCTKKRLDERKSAKQRGQTYDQLFVRHWDKWKDGRISKLFSIALDAERKPRGEPVPLTAALDADVPSKPLGARADYAFSPDGTQVVFAARIRGRTEPPVHELRHLARTRRRQRGPGQSHGRQSGLGCATGLFARRQTARASRDGPAGIRSGPFPARRARRRNGRDPVHDGRLGPFDRHIPILRERRSGVRRH